MPYDPAKDNDDDDGEAEGAGAWEGWMDPKTEEELFRRDLVIEEKCRQRQERILNAIERAQEIEDQKAEGVRIMTREYAKIEASWRAAQHQIQESLRASQGR